MDRCPVVGAISAGAVTGVAGNLRGDSKSKPSQMVVRRCSLDHINFFHPYDCEPYHENSLTRAYLVLLRLVPAVHRAFLNLIAKSRSAPRARLPNASEHPKAIVETQKGKIARKKGRLLSVLITDEHLSREARVTNTNRKSVLDGVLYYPKEWIFIIENKPDNRDVWERQLSSPLPRGHSINFEKKNVQLRWRDIISDLSDHLRSGRLKYTELTLVNNFLEYVLEHFETLIPYDSFKVCGNARSPFEKRCQQVMQEATGTLDLDDHDSTPCMRFAGAAVQIFLKPYQREEDDSGKIEGVELELWPGDTGAMAKILYPNLDVEALLRLAKKGWEIEPSFHFGFMQGGISDFVNTVAVGKYLRFWAKEENQDHICGIDNGCRRNGRTKKKAFWKRMHLFRHAGILHKKDWPELRRITSERWRKVSIRPGLWMSFKWPLSTAVQLDTRKGLFAREVKQRIKEAFKTWKQAFKPVK